MIEPKDFCHDEIDISDVHTSEQNLYRFKASVPAKQVDNFLFSVQLNFSEQFLPITQSVLL